MKPTVFLPEPIAANGMELLQAECNCLTPWLDGKKPERELLAQADAVIVRVFEIRTDDLARAPRLKVIAKHGVGVDNIDVAAATARRIPILWTPTANANAVAEHAMTLMLALARNLYAASTATFAGKWIKFEGVELAGKTLGVLGFGRIGRRVAEMARDGFAMQVRAYDPLVTQSDFTLERSLEAVLRTADFLTLHVPLTPETKHLMNAARLQLLKPNCRLINTSRGGVIDETALAQALQTGRLAGAALDVFDQEPLRADHPFLRTPNLLLTPHISSSTTESLARMSQDSAQGVLDVLHGRKPKYQLNLEALP
ncbi:MAG TPA: hydroxyacid dehydrogenase [Candidatus Eisenbacteria bacterium]|nr:hydroxyacid dehydrogenase [Candidatus Eisenbacteria bacterium]